MPSGLSPALRRTNKLALVQSSQTFGRVVKVCYAEGSRFAPRSGRTLQYNTMVATHMGDQHDGGHTHRRPTDWWPHTQGTNTMVDTHRGPTRWWLHTGNPNTTRWWPHKVTLLLWHYDGSVMNSCQRRWSVMWKIACSRPAVVERYIMRDASSCPCGALTAVYVIELVEANTRGTNTMVATHTGD